MKEQEVSAPFCELAKALVADGTGLPRNPERTVALRKLLEAKDAAVRALLAKGRRVTALRSTSTDAIVAFVFACWLFGHDFFEDARGRLYCIHCGRRP